MNEYYVRCLLLTVETMCESERIKQLSDAIRLIPDFPSPGVLFRFTKITYSCQMALWWHV